MTARRSHAQPCKNCQFIHVRFGQYCGACVMYKVRHGHYPTAEEQQLRAQRERPCKNCNKTKVGIRGLGFCAACYQYQYRTGRPRPRERYAPTPKPLPTPTRIVSPQGCSQCLADGRGERPTWKNGLCRACHIERELGA